MLNLNNIAFITNKYPNPLEENVLVFLQQLVWEISDLGKNCIVICPLPININLRYTKFPYKTTEVTENGSKVTIFFPKYIGFGQSEILGFNPAKLTTNNFTQAVRKVILKLDAKPDVIYGHFVTPAGITSARVGREFGIPSYMAYGESTPRTIKHFGYEETKKELETLAGVIAVSTYSKEVLVSTSVVKENIVEVFPNGYRKERFYPRDKKESRKMFGIPDDKFVVAFVGSFDHRKGIERLFEAINGLDDVYAICAGKGKLMPTSMKCLYSKPVNHNNLPYFYSAADIFVLPTLNEGCCNAIIEAMACGLPIISSNLPFNDDILDESCSIRVDPLNINKIKKSIKYLYSNRTQLKTLSRGSIEKAKELTLRNRVINILNFVNKS